MHTNRGFTLLEVLLIVVLIAVVGFAGWTWYQAREANDTQDTVGHEHTDEPDEEESEEDTAELSPGEIMELDQPVELTSADDINNLPAETPSSYINHLEQRLEDNDPDENNCIDKYTVRRISTVNIDVNEGRVNANTGDDRTCEPMYAGVRYTQDGETWERFVAAHAPPSCEDLVATNVYEEFHDGCVDPDAGPGETSPNPNGSIAQLAN